jgi:hypothetical protein
MESVRFAHCLKTGLISNLIHSLFEHTPFSSTLPFRIHSNTLKYTLEYLYSLYRLFYPLFFLLPLYPPLLVLYMPAMNSIMYSGLGLTLLLP